MKKLFIVLLTLFPVIFCFAKGQRDSFEVGLGYHSITESQTVSGTEVKTTVPSFAINYAGITLYTEQYGLGVYGNLLFPQELKMSALGQSVTVDASAYDFLFAMDVLLGPAFMLYRSDSICIPLSAGLHYFQLWSNASGGKTSSSSIGLGTNITAEYHFNPKIYVYGRFQLSFDFYSWGTTETYNGYGNSIKESSGKSMITTGIEPCIGIGFIF